MDIFKFLHFAYQLIANELAYSKGKQIIHEVKYTLHYE